MVTMRHSQEKVADMKSVNPDKAFPSEASIEAVLYNNASSDQEYAKPGNLALRVARAISDIERNAAQVRQGFQQVCSVMALRTMP